MFLISCAAVWMEQRATKRVFMYAAAAAAALDGCCDYTGIQKGGGGDSLIATAIFMTRDEGN